MTGAVIAFPIRYGEEMFASVERIQAFLDILSGGPYAFQFTGRGFRNSVYLHFEDAELGDAALCAWTAREWLFPPNESEP